jgi:hypothetical protein
VFQGRVQKCSLHVEVIRRHAEVQAQRYGDPSAPSVTNCATGAYVSS